MDFKSNEFKSISVAPVWLSLESKITIPMIPYILNQKNLDDY